MLTHTMRQGAMLSGPQRKFCEGIVSGLNGTDAYSVAYPKASRRSADANGARLIAKDRIQAEIQRMRDRAAERKGGAVLTLAEKRDFLARSVRAQIATLPHDSDLFVSVEYGKEGRKFKLGDKLAAIKLDNDLAGEGSEANASDALTELLTRIRK